jgi:hypothetical protein
MVDAHMSKRVTKRRPHGPINKRFSLMRWDRFTNRIIIEEPRRPYRHLPHVNPNAKTEKETA